MQNPKLPNKAFIHSFTRIPTHNSSNLTPNPRNMTSRSKAFLLFSFFVLLLLQLQFVSSVQGTPYSSSTTYNISHPHHHHEHHVKCRRIGLKCQTDKPEEDDRVAEYGDDKRKIHTGPNPLHNR